MRKILILFCAMFVGTAYACDTNQIDVLGDGTQCETTKFSLNTTNLTVNDTFNFSISATGTFYVDCGTDGTLSGTGALNKTVIRTDTNESLYTCTYTSGGAKTIRMAGRATGYNSIIEDYIRKYAAIRFGGLENNEGTTPYLIREISGSIGQIFPTLGQGVNLRPAFIATFARTKIRNIPANLFNDVYGTTTSMFLATFLRCDLLISIPENLFTGITGGSYKLFDRTFYGCTSLTSLPESLFRDVIHASDDEFMNTFAYCSSLTSIPAKLFSGITKGSSYMFNATFGNCTRLTSIPAGLFSGITTSAAYMFRYTFSNCTNITGYIPPSAFAGLVANNSQMETGMWTNTFNNANLATSCPAGTVQFITGYENSWDGRVSCVDENLVCGAGEYLPQHWFQCEKCPENNYCAGGTYAYSETTASGATSCTSGLYSPAGMWESAQCGRILHIGDAAVYLRSVKKTTPSLNIDIDNDGTPDFFGNMTTSDVVMSNGTTRKLKLQYGGNTYSVYDDSVNIPNSE